MFNVIRVRFVALAGKVFHNLSIQHQSSHVFFIARVDIGKLIHLLYSLFFMSVTLCPTCAM